MRVTLLKAKRRSEVLRIAYLKLLVMQVFKGFSWCVPSSFQNELDSCSFSVGDILYSDPDPYHSVWKAAVQRLRWSLQVKQVTATTVADGETIFDANWARGLVLVERTDYSGGRCHSRLIKTTQGKIYHTLVTGDPAVLELEGFLAVQRCDHELAVLDAVDLPETLKISRPISAIKPVPQPVATVKLKGLVQGVLF